MTKVAEFLHGIAFVFLEERCYSIEDTMFSDRCLEINEKYLQKFVNGLCFFLEDPTQQTLLSIHVEITLLTFVHPKLKILTFF